MVSDFVGEKKMNVGIGLDATTDDWMLSQKDQLFAASYVENQTWMYPGDTTLYGIPDQVTVLPMGQVPPQLFFFSPHFTFDIFSNLLSKIDSHISVYNDMNSYRAEFGVHFGVQVPELTVKFGLGKISKKKIFDKETPQKKNNNNNKYN